MAGIGFELKKLWAEGSYQSMIRAYGLSALMGSGPGLFIIMSLGLICFFTLFSTPSYLTSYKFLSIVTYLLSSSMIISSPLQYTFFRFLADKIFLKEFSEVTPNFIGVLLIQLSISICFAYPIVLYFFASHSFILKILLASNFIILSLIWLTVVLLTGLKSYRTIIWGFVLGYVAMIIVHFLIQKIEINWLLFELLLAQVILFIFLLHAILDYYPTNKCITFDFLKKENFYFSLMFSNFLYTLAFWIDKYLFWYTPDTSFVIYSPLRLSPLYDLPMFIAYLTIIPAIAVYILQMEGNFSLIYPKFMETIFNRKTMAEIEAVKLELVLAGREAVFSLFKTQAAVLVIMVLLSRYIFSLFEISTLYLDILFVLIVAVGLNVILWGLMNILYYLTQYRYAVYVSLIFLSTNLVFTLISLYVSPIFYGYGFALSMLFSIIAALIFLNKNFSNLEYTTFMMTD